MYEYGGTTNYELRDTQLFFELTQQENRRKHIPAN